MSLNNLKLCSWNVRGLHKPVKRRTVLSFLKREHVDFAFLQETHLEENKDLPKLQHTWIGEDFMTSYASNSRGVAILINKNIAVRSTIFFKRRGRQIRDYQGRFVWEICNLHEHLLPPQGTLLIFSPKPLQTLRN